MKMEMLKIALKHIAKVCFFRAPAMQCNEDGNVKDCTQTHSKSLFPHAPAMRCNEDGNVKNCTQTRCPPCIKSSRGQPRLRLTGRPMVVMHHTALTNNFDLQLD